MEISELPTFSVVARCGGITRAAVRAHTLTKLQGEVDTLFIQRRVQHEASALQSFAACLAAGKLDLTDPASDRVAGRKPRMARITR